MRKIFKGRLRISPEMAKPEKPTARTRNVMAMPFVCEKPTTSSRVASIPNPDAGKQNNRHKDFSVLQRKVLI